MVVLGGRGGCAWRRQVGVCSSPSPNYSKAEQDKYERFFLYPKPLDDYADRNFIVNEYDHNPDGCYLRHRC